MCVEGVWVCECGVEFELMCVTGDCVCVGGWRLS